MSDALPEQSSPNMGSTGEFVAPSFVKKPALRQEDDGNRLVFECKLAGNPKPEVSWFREDVKIQNDERATFKVQEEGRNTFAVILELNDVVETDAGLYKVKAKNKYGEVSASINLNFSREYYSIYFIISVVSTKLCENALLCQVQAKSKPSHSDIKPSH